MPQIVNSNIYTMNSQRVLNRSQADLGVAMQRLSSGLRINSAMDDAAGLAIATRMETQIRGTTVAMRNAGDGISYSQIADSAFETGAAQVQRMRELAVQAMNPTLSGGDRTKLQAEYSRLDEEFTRIQETAKMNGINVLGTASVSFQVGAEVGDTISATYEIVTAPGGDVNSITNAQAAMDSTVRALEDISEQRAVIGATQSRLNFTIQYLESARENQSAAKSRIMDADFAQETAALSRAQILQQSGIAMVSQANQVPQGVLSLLR